jgi:hypothetical protein
MPVGRVLWLLFKTIVFTALVPGTVGLWVPYRIRQGTRAPDVVVASAIQIGLSHASYRGSSDLCLVRLELFRQRNENARPDRCSKKPGQ